MLAVGKRKMTAKRVLSHKIDIKAGNMTFGQRIELGNIITGNDDELIKITKIIEELHGFKPDNRQLLKLEVYIQEILEGILHWTKTESVMLKYTPTAKERQAGINDLSKKIGTLSTVDALAKKYSKDPDEVLTWNYAKVFGILYADLEISKYQRKYSEILKK